MSASYDEIADWYDRVVRGGTIVQDAAMGVLHNLAGNVEGLSICDLACGQGILARGLAGRGARVTGIDTSTKLLEIARRDEGGHPLGIQYSEMDAQTLAGFSASIFDGVVCNLALMDIANLAATSASVFRVLRSSGWFAFSIMHPCFQTSDSAWVADDSRTGRLVRAYFAEGRWHPQRTDGMRARVGAVHRTLSTYLNTLTSAGLVLHALSEPQLAREPGRLEPAYDEVPAVLGARFIKP